MHFTEGERKVFGRNHNEILKHEMTLSGNHCEFYWENNKFYVHDLNSSWGTWFRLSSKNEASKFFPLKDEIVLRFG